MIGYWCEDYGLYGQEDLDYGLRIQLAGLLNIYMDDNHTASHIGAADNPEYMAWKKEQFEKNNNYEKIANNVYGFFKGSRSLYYRANYAETYLSMHQSPADNEVQAAQKRMFSLIRSGN